MLARALLLFFVLSLAACSGAAPPPAAVAPGEMPPVAQKADAPTSDTPPAATPPGPEPVQPGNVVIEAEARAPHMVGQHPLSGALDAQGRPLSPSYLTFEGGELVVYAAETVECPGKVTLTGRWTGASGDKGGQHVSERQFIADRWACVGAR